MKCSDPVCNESRAAGWSMCARHAKEVARSEPDVPAITPKQNEGKRRFSLGRWEFTRAIAEVMTWGLTKYPAENYLSMDSQTLYDSMMRHLDAHLSGDKIDEESGKPHLWHFASNAMMWFMLERRKDEGK